MNRQSVRELYVASFENPEKFKGDVLERLLELHERETEEEIRKRLSRLSRDTAAVLLLLLEDSSRARFPGSEIAKTYHAKIGSRAMLLERVLNLIESFSSTPADSTPPGDLQ